MMLIKAIYDGFRPKGMWSSNLPRTHQLTFEDQFQDYLAPPFHSGTKMNLAALRLQK
jgi:hypothetical protein